ncbi:hypothetical protein M0802_011014 [Mischocyttarus mexicanus]|nr:hypothetical protein M0802_011014 [Mischocyttarus mexicanus]
MRLLFSGIINSNSSCSSEAVTILDFSYKSGYFSSLLLYHTESRKIMFANKFKKETTQQRRQQQQRMNCKYNSGK